MIFDAGELLRVRAALRAAGCQMWIAGGWGVDALVGRVTRDHHDLDLLHRAEQEPRVIGALEALGYTERDGAAPGRPARFVMADDLGRELDLHPLRFAADGSAVQDLDDRGGALRYPAAAFTSGTVAGRRVPCLSAAQQLAFHQGYEPRERDLHDLALLRDLPGATGG
ncbi:nucleotidyltransferase domain-containing protein [Nonomuraea sp. NPDC049684]|uniref:nucleotidyltransferase domain-containing protein n=1 Tax=Nonomuraea sp. NPDC049684 TaxID=3364356 RepID=UPI0037B6AEB9